MGDSPEWLADPPAGQQRNLVNPPSRKELVLSCGYATTTVAALIILLRVWVRTTLHRGLFGLDDVFVLLGFLSTVALLFITVKQIGYGFGHHDWDVRSALQIPNYTYDFAGSIVYCLCISFPKLSVFIFYIRIFRGRAWLWRAGWACFGFISAYSLFFCFVSIFSCKPMAAAWNYWADYYSVNNPCHANKIPIYYFLSILNIVMDFAALLLPVYGIWGLHISTRKKISLIVLFMAGGASTIISIKRTTAIDVSGSSYDANWDGAFDSYLSFIEINLSIMCASLPALKPLLKYAMPKRFMSITPPSSEDPQIVDVSSSGGKSSNRGFYSSAVDRNRKKRENKWLESYRLFTRNGNATNRSNFDDEISLGYTWQQNRRDNEAERDYGKMEEGQVSDGVSIPLERIQVNEKHSVAIVEASSVRDMGARCWESTTILDQGKQ